MANLAWHQKFHSGRACGFDSALDYNAWMLSEIDEQPEKAANQRRKEKNLYRSDYSVNDYEFQVLREKSDCAVREVGFEEFESAESSSPSLEPVERRSSSQDVVARLRSIVSDESRPTTGEIIVWQDDTYQVSMFQTSDDRQRVKVAVGPNPEEALEDMLEEPWEDPSEGGDTAQAGALAKLGVRLTSAQKKKWIRRAVFGGLAASTVAIAGALGYWAFKPKNRR